MEQLKGCSWSLTLTDSLHQIQVFGITSASSLVSSTSMFTHKYKYCIGIFFPLAGFLVVHLIAAQKFQKLYHTYVCDMICVSPAVRIVHRSRRFPLPLFSLVLAYAGTLLTFKHTCTEYRSKCDGILFVARGRISTRINIEVQNHRTYHRYWYHLRIAGFHRGFTTVCAVVLSICFFVAYRSNAGVLLKYCCSGKLWVGGSLLVSWLAARCKQRGGHVPSRTEAKLLLVWFCLICAVGKKMLMALDTRRSSL